MSLANTPQSGTYWIYRVFDSSDQLLYLGITGNPRLRLKAHKSKPWFQDAARFVWSDVGADRRVALDAETAALTAERPLYTLPPKQRAEERMVRKAAAHERNHFCGTSNCLVCRRRRVSA